MKKINFQIENNIFWQKNFINKNLREKKNKHVSLVLWFTGLSGSGKSTISNYLEKKLYNLKFNTYLLDGDNIRTGLCKDLSFCSKDRLENIRRIAEVSKLMLDAGLLVLTSVISPNNSHRNLAKDIIGRKNFIEIFVDTPIEICEKRDPKKLYKKYRMGKIKNFTGLDSKYENPKNPDIHINGTEDLNNIIDKIIIFLKKKLV